MRPPSASSRTSAISGRTASPGAVIGGGRDPSPIRRSVVGAHEIRGGGTRPPRYVMAERGCARQGSRDVPVRSARQSAEASSDQPTLGTVMTSAVLQLVGVKHDYARTSALRGVSMQVESGEVVAVTGPSGCGKSPLLHLGCGILHVQQGTVRLLGRDLAALNEAERSRLRRR